jgi:hypothetical protein
MNNMSLTRLPVIRAPAFAANHANAIRIALGMLLAFAALNAFGGGTYGMAGAEGVPVEWLEGTPFTSYTIPSLILFVVVGGGFLFAAVATFARAPFARAAAAASAVIVLGWIFVQVMMIGSVSWMQPATAVGGLVILCLAWLSGAKRTPHR